MYYRTKTHLQTYIMFLPSSFITGQFILIFKLTKLIVICYKRIFAMLRTCKTETNVYFKFINVDTLSSRKHIKTNLPKIGSELKNMSNQEKQFYFKFKLF